MTGIELVLAALAAGASAGITNVASSAATDSYQALRAKVTSALVGRASAVAISEQVTPEEWPATLEVDLQEAGVASDPIVIELAHKILEEQKKSPDQIYADLRESKGVQVGSQNSQTNNFS